MSNKINLSNKDLIILENQKEIKNLKKEVSNLHLSIEKVQDMYNKIISKQDEKITKQEIQLKVKDKTIKIQKTKLTAKDDTIKKLKDEVFQLNTNINAFRDQKRKLDAKLYQQDLDLEKYENGTYMRKTAKEYVLSEIGFCDRRKFVKYLIFPKQQNAFERKKTAKRKAQKADERYEAAKNKVIQDSQKLNEQRLGVTKTTKIKEKVKSKHKKQAAILDGFILKRV